MILYFTGNGNTRLIAEKTAPLLDGKLRQLCGGILIDPSEFHYAPQEGESIVWMFPVYSWGVPPVVRRFILESDIQCQPGTCHHLIATMGDDAGLTDLIWRELIARRGWTSASVQGVIMPNTFTTLPGFDVDSKALAHIKLQRALADIPKYAAVIRSNANVTYIKHGGFAWLKSRVIYPGFSKGGVNPSKFHSHDCIRCGRCVRNCPMDNITLAETPDASPVWGENCAMCLGCYNICPVHAIEYGRSTLRKGQYHCDIRK